MQDSIEKIAGDLGDTYFLRANAEKLQDALRMEFFNAATVSQEDKVLATKTWVTPSLVSDPEELALKYNPGWLIYENEPGDAFILIEDPDFKQVSVTVNGEDGRYVVTKQIRSGSTLLDDERLIDNDPDLWEEVSYIPGIDLLSNWIPDKDLDSVAEQLGLKRVPRNPDDLTPAERAAIQPYLYEGKKVKALTVKIAKDDE